MYVKGDAEYVMTQDADELAKILIDEEIQRANFLVVTLTPTLTLLAIPAIYSSSSQIFSVIAGLSMHATSIGCYPFSPDRIQEIQKSLQGLSFTNAQLFLRSQPDIDPASIQLKLLSGSGQKMPEDAAQIHITSYYPRD